jgi:general secretion pathway protein G
VTELPNTAAGESPVAERPTGVWILLGALVAFAGTILWLLYHFVLGPGLMGNVVRQRQAAAHSEILVLHTALEGWSARNQGRYPEFLAAIVEPDEQGGTLLGGELALPQDPWGRAYVYSRPTPGQLRPNLRSLGRDGLPGGAGEDADVDREGVVGAR